MKFTKSCLLGMALAALLFTGCTPDEFEVKVSTSMVEKVMAGQTGSARAKAMFSMMGDDKDGDLKKAIAIAEQYLGPGAQIVQKAGDMGTGLSATFKIPVGTAEALSSSSAPIALVYDSQRHTFTLESLPAMKRLNAELSDINMMLGVDLKGGKAIFRITGNSDRSHKFRVFGAFVNDVPKPVDEFSVAEDDDVEIRFNRSSDCVYNTVSPFLVMVQ